MGSHPEPPDCIDEKDVSGLSTILVATIQEVKDRITQIEYIFCRQLFPDFLSKSRSLEVARGEQESDLLLQIDRLKLEKQQAVMEGQFLRKELVQLAKEKEEVVEELSNLQLQVNNLQCDLKQKIEEIDEGVHHQEELRQLVKSHAVSSKDPGRQLAGHVEEKPLLAKHKCLEAANTVLLEDLRKKDAEPARWNQFQVNPLKEDLLWSEGPSKEKALFDSQKRDELILVRSRASKVNVCAEEKELPKETEKAESRNSEKRFIGSIVEPCVDIEMPTTLLQLKGEERQVLRFGGRRSGEDLNEDQQKYFLELLLLSERKRIDAVNSYKQLKSQYNFLCKKVGLSPGDPVKKSLLEDSFSRHRQKDVTTAQRGSTHSTIGVHHGIKIKKEVVYEDLIALEDGKEYEAIDNSSSLLHGFSKIVKSTDQDGIKEEHLTNDRGDTEVEDTSPPSPDFSQDFPSGHVIGGKLNITTGEKHTATSGRGTPSGSLNGGELNITTSKKRTASSWRGTRSNHNGRSPDPHDDFLDTPFENIRENLNKAGKYGGSSSTAHESREGVISSDDGSKDLVANWSHQKQQRPVSSAGDRSFKFAAPTRRKDEREHLKGIECRQCKKFFDALSDCESKDGTTLHCEHHDGISRHRYRYVPPLTPEGFWSIGFESET